MMPFSAVRDLIERELSVDRAFDDVTGRLLGKLGSTNRSAVVSTREPGVFCGSIVCDAFPVPMECLVQDGDTIHPGQALVRFDAPAGTCLAIERTLLNFLAHLCGVASLTRKFVDAVQPYPAKILATRKTLPGLRDLQLQAVKAGGGFIHRRSLSDGILIKDNHLSLWDERSLINEARRIRSPLHRIEIEVQNLDSLAKALEASPDIIMLDNFSVRDIREALAQIANRCEVEISGGVSLDTVRELASTGVQYISVGQLTHSVRALDLTLDFGA